MARHSKPRARWSTCVGLGAVAAVEVTQRRYGGAKSIVASGLILKVQVFRGQKYQAAYPIPKVSSAFCYEKHPFDAGTKSIETSIATRIDAVRRGFADTESIEPDIDTKSRAAAYFWK